MRNVVAGAVAAAVVVLAASSADAADLRLLASNGIKAAIEQLEAPLETASGGTLSVDFSTTATLRERIEAGEPFDIAILTDDAMEALAKAGRLASSGTKLARVGIGVGYRKGASKPDVRTADGIRRSLLASKSIAYTGNGASRPAIDRMIERLGITQQIRTKSRLTTPGAAPAAVAKGEADLVMTLISEILPEPGVELAGPLPADFQTYLGFSAAASPKAAKDPHVASVIQFLSGGAAASAYTAKGMEAAR